MQIQNEKDVDTLINAIAADALDARHHRELHRNLVEAAESHEREFAQARTFWWLTVRAHADVALYRLARLYDQREDSVSLKSWLDVLADNVELFDARRFRQRLRDNPFVKSLAQTARRPNDQQLGLDRESVNARDPVVAKLLALRHKALAHRDADVALGRASREDDQQQLSWTDVDLLIERAIEILNRYSSLFRASSYARDIVGHDDYQGLLRMTREWLAHEEARIEQEAAQLSDCDGEQ